MIPEAMAEVVFRFFGASDSPNYIATHEIFLRDPYRMVREELGSRWNLFDRTDYNYDLGNVFVLRGHPEGISVRLSFVGPYAVLLTPEGETSTSPAVAEVVCRAGFQILEREQLSERVDLWAPEVTGLLYEFLFEFDEGVPWDRW